MFFLTIFFFFFCTKITEIQEKVWCKIYIQAPNEYCRALKSHFLKIWNNWKIWLNFFYHHSGLQYFYCACSQKSFFASALINNFNDSGKVCFFYAWASCGETNMFFNCDAASCSSMHLPCIQYKTMSGLGKWRYFQFFIKLCIDPDKVSICFK